jgi:hypothetical protein
MFERVAKTSKAKSLMRLAGVGQEPYGRLISRKDTREFVLLWC